MNLNNQKWIVASTKFSPRSWLLFAIVTISTSALAGYDEGVKAYKNADYATVLKEAKLLSEQGDARGYWSLGWLYEQGLGVPQDYKLAGAWYQKAAQLGIPDAQNRLGWLCENGKGVSQDYKLAVNWYTKAAEQEFAEAENNLGRLYETGQGVGQDYKVAIDWYTKAAKKRNAEAQFRLGMVYASGQGVKQDYKLAEKWFWRAANQGFAKAQYNLGVLYQNGQGVRQDAKIAESWYTKAAEQGYASAQYNLGVLFASANEFRKAADWYAKAAGQNDADAQANLGLMYENGQGVPKSYKLSYALFELGGKIELRTKLMEKMSSEQIDEAQRLSKILAQPGNLKQALNTEVVRVQEDGGSEQTYEEAMALAKRKLEMTNAVNKIILDKWIGRGERELMLHKYWGVPQQTYETGGIKYLAFDFSSTETIAGSPAVTTTQVNTQSYSNYQWEGVNTAVTTTSRDGTPAESYKLPCRVIFATQAGLLAQWSLQGTGCIKFLGAQLSP